MAHTNEGQLRLGTRGSMLARWQADWVSAQLRETGVHVELVPITTVGDTDARPVGTIGGQGLFTKEIQRALLDERIDLAVHSLKDLPTDQIPGLMLAAVPERESPFDALVTSEATDLSQLPPAARVGTGSQRRRAQLLHHRADLEVLDIRGNVDTRLRKLDDADFDAIVLAEAGLKRLGLSDRLSHVLPASIVMPAVGQGALGLECRVEDDATRSLVAGMNHAHSFHCVQAERALLAKLRAGCSAPVGAWCRVERSRLYLESVVLSTDGQQRLHAAAEAAIDQPAEVAAHVAEALLAEGAAELIATVSS